MTAVVITTTSAVPTVGGDEDTWGTKTNAKWATVKADLDALALTPANTLKGNNTGSPAGVNDLTVAQAAAMLPAVIGDAGSGGTKGLVPAPAAGQARYPLIGDGTFKRGVGRLAGGVFTMTLSDGATVTAGAASLNIASASVLTVTGTQASFVITFTSALPDTDYSVNLTAAQGALVGCRYFSKSTTQVTVAFDTTGGSSPAELSVSIF